jgi:hypothetical protein
VDMQHGAWLMTAILEKLLELKRVAEGAQNQFPLELTNAVEDGVYECPACDGNGHVEGETWNTSRAANIQAFGIGADLEATEQYVEHMTPPTVLSLINALQVALGVMEVTQKHYLHPNHDHNWAHYIHEQQQVALSKIEEIMGGG